MSALLVIPVFFIFFLLFELFFYLIKNNKINFNSKIFNTVFFISYSIISGSVFASCIDYSKFISNNISNLIIYIFLIIFCVVMILSKAKGLIKLNLILTPLLIIAFLALCSFRVATTNLIAKNLLVYTDIINLMLNSIIYPAINITCCLFILKDIAKEKEINTKFISLITSLIIAVFLIVGILALNTTFISKNLAMPFLEICVNLPNYVSKAVCFMIIIASITTLASCVYSLYQTMPFRNTFLKAFIEIIIIVLLSFIGFDNIVDYLYPMVGVGGLMLAIYSLLSTNFLFKKSNKIVHKSSKYANKNNASHN